MGNALQALLPRRLPLETGESMKVDWRFAPQCCAWQSVHWRRRVRRRFFHAVHASLKLGMTGMLPLPLVQASEASPSPREGQYTQREEPSARRRPIAGGPAASSRTRRPQYALCFAKYGSLSPMVLCTFAFKRSLQLSKDEG
jgi:hypothetical protein